MATAFPLTTVAAQVTSAGISAPSYNDILASLQANFQSIYGADVYLGADSQDGQLLAIFARAIHDCNQTAIAVYNSFSPATAQGAALSQQVRLNHLQRLSASNSQANVTLTGVAGTTITSGVVKDVAGNKWDLPPTVIIPSTGSIVVTATCQVAGAVQAATGTITSIDTPALGWQSVTNASPASPGNVVESDAQLRRRQETSPPLRSRTIIEGLRGELLALDGVDYCVVYENDTGTTDANGLPPHSIAVVIQGGDSAEIAATIYRKKTTGCATFGTTTVNTVDALGGLTPINFFVPALVYLSVEVRITVNAFYTAAIGDEIKQALVSYIQNLPVGEDVTIPHLYIPALLSGGANSATYNLQSVKVAEKPATVGTSDIPIPFTSKAVLEVADVQVVLV